MRFCLTATSDERADVRELAEGLTGDLDATLAAVRWLVVAVRERQHARDYALKCTLRSRGDRLRLEARLFEPGGMQIWARKFGGDLANCFDWQDSTAEAVALDVITKMLDAERDRMSRIRLEDRTAEECLVLGFMQLRLGDSPSFVDSLSSNVQAIEKDPVWRTLMVRQSGRPLRGCRSASRAFYLYTRNISRIGSPRAVD